MLRYSLALIGLLAAAPASSAVITVMVGDDDCFGLSISCADGSTFPGGTTPSDRSTASDPAGMDVFGFNGALSFGVTVDLAGETLDSATLQFKVVGLDLVDRSSPLPFGDAFHGTRIQMNGSDVGLYAPGDAITPIPVDEVDFISVALNPADVINGANTFSLIPEEGFEQFSLFEDFAVDFMSLTLNTSLTVTPPTTPVPLPATGLLLLAGLGAFGAMRRRK